MLWWLRESRFFAQSYLAAALISLTDNYMPAPVTVKQICGRVLRNTLRRRSFVPKVTTHCAHFIGSKSMRVCHNGPLGAQNLSLQATVYTSGIIFPTWFASFGSKEGKQEVALEAAALKRVKCSVQ